MTLQTLANGTTTTTTLLKIMDIMGGRIEQWIAYLLLTPWPWVRFSAPEIFYFRINLRKLAEIK